MSFNYSKYKKEIPSKSKKKKEIKHSFVAPPADEPYPKWFARMRMLSGWEHTAYPYYSNGNCMFVIRRYEPGELKGSTKKQLVPWAYCEIKKEWCKGIIEDNRPLFYKKDMGILAIGGFTFELSKRVLNLDSEEFNKVLKII